MAVDTKIHYASVDELWLDPLNPRLGQELIDQELDQDQLLKEVGKWTVEELAVSFLENGFWPQEALIVIKERNRGIERLVVVEGNRRLAALKLLELAVKKKPVSSTWSELIKEKKPASDLFAEIPYLLAKNRHEVQAYIGYRHVTGIKQWAPAEKAAFIANMIDESHMDYKEVKRAIGSKEETVRRNYISYRILLQMKNLGSRIAIEKVEEKFSVLFLSLRTDGVQTYLNIDIQADPAKAKQPIPKAKLDALVCFARWLFGTKDEPPIVNDSRQVDRFAKALKVRSAVEYLERNKAPKLETAYRLAGGEEFETIESVRQASDSVREALATVHLYLNSKPMRAAVEEFGIDALELLRRFPDIKDSLWARDAEMQRRTETASKKK